MKIEKIVEIFTRDDVESFEVEELKDTFVPNAFHINYRNFGYGKFKIDKNSLSVF